MAEQEDSFVAAKVQQKRDSIMNELYNEISSSDDEEDEEEAKTHNQKNQGSSPTKSESEDTKASQKGTAVKQSSGDGKDEPQNPFKRQASTKNDALKELYGDDYEEEPIGFENVAQTGEQQIKLRDKIASKLSNWFASAKDKYNEELQNPNSKVNIYKQKLASLNDEIKEKSQQSLVQMGIDEPLNETEYGMVNPNRQGLDQFLKAEEAKQKLEESKQREEQLALQQLQQEHTLQEEEEKKEARAEDEAPDADQGEFKFTIDADEDEDVDVIEKAEEEEDQAEDDSAAEKFEDSDDEDTTAGETPSSGEKDQAPQIEEESKEPAKEEEDANNPYSRKNQSMEKGQTVWLTDFHLVFSKKMVKRPGYLKSIVSQVKEERLLTLYEGNLFSLKRVPSTNAAAKSISRFFAAKLPESNQEALAQNDRGMIKNSANQISRLFKVDVTGKGRGILGGDTTELELILHFVNKELNPLGKPELKKYLLRADEDSKKFLAQLQVVAKEKSKFYK